MTGTGTILIEKFVNSEWCDGHIEDVLYVPMVRKNLFSVGICISKGFDMHFRQDFVVISRWSAHGIGTEPKQRNV